MNKLLSVTLLVAVLVAMLAMTALPGKAAPLQSTGHPFDLASICRKVYQADGHPLSDLSADQYRVDLADSQNAYTWRCSRQAGPLAARNRADGLGEYRGYFYGRNVYGFNLYQACQNMAGGRPFELRLGDSRNPRSWGCWY